jgi:hypothetical protein
MTQSRDTKAIHQDDTGRWTAEQEWGAGRGRAHLGVRHSRLTAIRAITTGIPMHVDGLEGPVPAVRRRHRPLGTCGRRRPNPVSTDLP